MQFPHQVSRSQFVNTFILSLATGRFTGFNQAAGIDYSIRGGQTNSSTTAQFVLLINEDLSWASVTVSYLISSRNDFWVGSFLPDTFGLIPSTSTSIVVQQDLQTWTSQSGSFNFVYLISGLKTNDNSFNVDLTSASFNPQTGRISV
jgi:hypothetical protein